MICILRNNWLWYDFHILMNIYLKQTLYIVFISLFLSIVRYFFIEEEYPIIKSVSKASIETYSVSESIDS